MSTLQRILALLISLSILPIFLLAQNTGVKKEISTDERIFLQKMIEEISKSDQKYRKYLSDNTLDDVLIARMDSVYEAAGIEAYVAYQKSLELKLDQTLKDSLWMLQHAIDLKNHLTLKGIFETYGFLPKELLDKKFYVQLILLVHPPKDWDIPTYLAEYGVLLSEEVQAGRMPAITYATFYDNIKGKILREPQLYGTNQQYDPATQKVMPPGIVNLKATNDARTAIGLPALKAGEYRILSTNESKE
jgi:hypothetical protein